MLSTTEGLDSHGSHDRTLWQPTATLLARDSRPWNWDWVSDGAGEVCLGLCRREGISCYVLVGGRCVQVVFCCCAGAVYCWLLLSVGGCG